MTTPSTHRLLIECPETGETREPTQADVLGETPEQIRARVEEVLDSLAPKARS